MKKNNHDFQCVLKQDFLKLIFENDYDTLNFSYLRSNIEKCLSFP